MTLLLLALISCLTSLVAALIGFGGGMLLLALLPLWLPPAALIPLHGITQLCSNSSRALLAPKDVLWSVLPAFLAGSAGGLALGFFMWQQLSSDWLPLLIGGYMLLNLWHAPFKRWVGRFEHFALLGFLQTGLGLFVGATGPLTMTALLKRTSNQHQIIATSAMLMTISHLAKVLLFGVLGFAFADYLWPLLALCLGAVAGSWLGSKIRPPQSNPQYLLLLKWALTLLAGLMIASLPWRSLWAALSAQL